MSCLYRGNQKAEQPPLRCLLPPCSTPVSGVVSSVPGAHLSPVCLAFTLQPLQSPSAHSSPGPESQWASLSLQCPTASPSHPDPIHLQTQWLCQPPAPSVPDLPTAPPPSSLPVGPAALVWLSLGRATGPAGLWACPRRHVGQDQSPRPREVLPAPGSSTRNAQQASQSLGRARLRTQTITGSLSPCPPPAPTP